MNDIEMMIWVFFFDFVLEDQKCRINGHDSVILRLQLWSLILRLHYLIFRGKIPSQIHLFNLCTDSYP